MKKLITVVCAAACVLIMAALIFNTNPAQSSPKNDKGGKPIPENVMKIASKSCVICHTEPGNPMAIAHVNLSKWDKYSAKKQAAKAADMCTMVTKEKMPPKKFRESHPDGVPSAEELKIICDWAASIQVPKK